MTQTSHDNNHFTCRKHESHKKQNGLSEAIERVTKEEAKLGKDFYHKTALCGGVNRCEITNR
jgi:hypothetical protein